MALQIYARVIREVAEDGVRTTIPPKLAKLLDNFAEMIVYGFPNVLPPT